MAKVLRDLPYTMTGLAARHRELVIRQHRRMRRYDDATLAPHEAEHHMRIACRLKRKRMAVEDKMRLRGEE